MVEHVLEGCTLLLGKLVRTYDGKGSKRGCEDARKTGFDSNGSVQCGYSQVVWRVLAKHDLASSILATRTEVPHECTS